MLRSEPVDCPITPPKRTVLGRYFLLAVAAHLALVATFWALQRLVTTETSEQNVIEVELIAFSPEPPQALERALEVAEPEPTSSAEIVPVPMSEPVPEPEPEPAPEPKIRLDQTFESDIKTTIAGQQTGAPLAEPTAETVVEKVAELNPEPKPEPEPAPEPVAVPKSQAVKPKPTKPVAATPAVSKVPPPRESSVATRATTPAVYDAAYLKNPAPRYPMSAIREKAEGTVVVRAEILANGQSGRVELQTSSGFDSLDNAAMSTIKKWRFKPAMVDGQPTNQWVTIPITFRLTTR